MSQFERAPGCSEFTHQARAAYLEEVVLPNAAIVKPLFDGFDPDALDYDAMRAKIGANADANGVRALYYAGMFVWQNLKEQLAAQDVGEHFRGMGQLAVEHYTFRSRPYGFIEGQLQSSLSAPTILVAWTAMSGTASTPDHWMRSHIVEAPKAAVIDMLRSAWFPDLLRDASISRGGLYRNATGLTLNYASFSSRSVIGPLREYQAAVPDGQFPVEADADGRNNRTDGRLSDDFRAFLLRRMRDHNSGLDPEAPLHDGSTRGCLYAHETHIVSDVSQLSSDIGYVEGEARPDGRVKVHVTWDPYTQISHMLAAVLERV